MSNSVLLHAAELYWLLHKTGHKLTQRGGILAGFRTVAGLFL